MRENLKSAIEVLTKTDRGLVTAISSGCELFLRFITLTALDNPVRYCLHVPRKISAYHLS